MLVLVLFFLGSEVGNVGVKGWVGEGFGSRKGMKSSRGWQSFARGWRSIRLGSSLECSRLCGMIVGGLWL